MRAGRALGMIVLFGYRSTKAVLLTSPSAQWWSQGVPLVASCLYTDLQPHYHGPLANPSKCFTSYPARVTQMRRRADVSRRNVGEQ